MDFLALRFTVLVHGKKTIAMLACLQNFKENCSLTMDFEMYSSVFTVYGFSVRQKDWCDGSFRKMSVADTTKNYDGNLKENCS